MLDVCSHLSDVEIPMPSSNPVEFNRSTSLVLQFSTSQLLNVKFPLKKKFLIEEQEEGEQEEGEHMKSFDLRFENPTHERGVGIATFNKIHLTHTH